ncbi:MULTISPECIES: carbohydrate ABC transporter permease [Paenibacillus]|jgi:putative aldouronate transport system permease protein|uniref:Sugar ABC transporter permease n=1 Tax=Paenibacillus odorifer TaxID=189426 RepID=A0A1R0WQN5_9BACL|nr:MULTISPECIES: carbohydrate ABC transporter permease [Paenibacillus]AIQ76428.1 sugar ABC transporter permease [Paenibacillus odorifer]ETT50594.1 ABC transporter permease [Paenibacillus sp. FSL H8-237]MDH6431490.1 putative aldouronate transport system permease protein [Paenibacillus sp. PastH-4]MDH6447556.1 putative aldouronate transport system permease protein [Paenibacillus sp. PastF-4]MDH6531726.1 putative aldouronate transport system permease protein [Paenibacillus sp. PastH-3]
MKIQKDKYTRMLHWIAYVVIIGLSIACLLPFLLIISASLTSNESIIRDGYHLIPAQFSLEGYKTVFIFPDEVLRAYAVTVSTTAIGTVMGLFFMTMAGYVLARKDFKYRNSFSFYIYFTTLFGGGLVPWYIMITKYLGLLDSYAVLVLPGLMTPFLIILMKNFIKSAVPEELFDSGKIDGAGDFRIYWQIVLKLSMPGIATVGLFLALYYWNDWFTSSLFINDTHKYQLQFYLYNVINSAQFIAQMGAGTGVSLATEVPAESTKMAMAIVVTGPILFLYPFVQRYFVKGLTIGAVKG